jgi:hypothetical protein
LGRDGQINMEPPSGRTLPAGLEGGIRVLLPMIAPQRQPKALEQLMLIASRGIKIPGKRGVWGNVEPTFSQHAKIAKSSNGVWMQMDQLAP